MTIIKFGIFRILKLLKLLTHRIFSIWKLESPNYILSWCPHEKKKLKINKKIENFQEKRLRTSFSMKILAESCHQNFDKRKRPRMFFWEVFWNSFKLLFNRRPWETDFVFLRKKLLIQKFSLMLTIDIKKKW